MSRKVAWVVLGVLLGAALSGCSATVLRVADPPAVPEDLYLATRLDAGLAFSSSNEWLGTEPWYLRPFYAVDLPFTFVLDTVLLPFDYLRFTLAP